jgi:uncharacterized protein
MDARIVEFAEVLRQNGIRVGTSEVADAGQAVAELGLERRDVFRSALRSTLVKRGADTEVFDRAFEFFFLGAATALESLDNSLLEALQAEGLLEGDELAMVVASLRQLVAGLSPLAQAALQGDRAGLAKILAGSMLELNFVGLESPLQSGFFSRRLIAAAGRDRAWADLKQIEAELKARGISAAGLQLVSQHLSQAMRKVEAAARQEVERELRARMARRGSAIMERPLHALSAAEVERMKEAVRRLAQKLKTRLMRRQRSSRRGVLHVRRTLRKNLTWGAIPLILSFRQRRPERPEVWVVCDVSDSVRNVSRMMLLFTYTLQSLFRRVRSLVFVSDLGEVTPWFRELKVNDAVDLATAGKAVSLHANSNYGRALGQLARDYSGALNRRTTVLIIGDGRNNYHPNNAWVLDEIRRKARRLIWICSENRRAWGLGDSEMLTYSRGCDQVLIVETFGDLARIADQLLPIR